MRIYPSQKKSRERSCTVNSKKYCKATLKKSISSVKSTKPSNRAVEKKPMLELLKIGVVILPFIILAVRNEGRMSRIETNIKWIMAEMKKRNGE
jgi:hypothetical protein